MQYFLSLTTGLVAGAIFAFAKLPIPAPSAFAGVLGILGIWGGFAIVSGVMK